MESDNRADEVGFVLALICMVGGACIAVVVDLLTGAIVASLGAFGSYYFARGFDGSKRRRVRDAR